MVIAQRLSHDSVYRVLSEGKHCFSILALNRLQVIGRFKGGYAVLDDSMMVRFGSGKFKLKKIKNSSTRQYTYGFNIILLIWTNGTIRIPIGVRIFLAHEDQKQNRPCARDAKRSKAIGLRTKVI
jgi:hypothetical protein